MVAIQWAMVIKLKKNVVYINVKLCRRFVELRIGYLYYTVFVVYINKY